MKGPRHTWLAILLSALLLASCGSAGPEPVASQSSKPVSVTTSGWPSAVQYSGSSKAPAVPSSTTSAPTRPKPSSASAKPGSKPKARSGAGWVERVRRCVLHRESRGNYKIRSKVADPNGRYAWGGYQFQDATWRSVTGLPGHASQYPKAVQDAAFVKLFDNGKGKHHWALPKGWKGQCW